MSDPFAMNSGKGTRRAKVLFDYAALADNQISIKKGTTIDIVHQGHKGGWTKGVDPDTGT